MKKNTLAVIAVAILVVLAIWEIREASLPSKVVRPQSGSEPTAALDERQAVQHQINVLLIQATVLRATGDALRAGTEMPEQAKTAHAQESLDNSAAIETLRPTARAANLILYEHQITPTLEEEATLFAKAKTVSAPFTHSLTATAAERPAPTATPIPYAGPYPAGDSASPTADNNIGPTAEFTPTPDGAYPPEALPSPTP